jgi:Winged helix-turn helix
VGGCRSGGQSSWRSRSRGLTQAQAARRYRVSESFVSRLLGRWRLEGEGAFEPRCRRPHRSPTAIDPDVVERIVNLRVALARKGLDAGPATIAWHLDAVGITDSWPPGLSSRNPRSDRGPPMSGSKPTCRMSAGSRTAPTGVSGTAPTATSSPGSMTPPATPYRSPPTATSPAPSSSTPSRTPLPSRAFRHRS